MQACYPGCTLAKTALQNAEFRPGIGSLQASNATTEQAWRFAPNVLSLAHLECILMLHPSHFANWLVHAN